MSRRSWRRILGTLEAKAEAALMDTPHPLDAGLEALTLAELRELRAIRAKLAAGLALDPWELKRAHIITRTMETAAPDSTLGLIYTRETPSPQELP